MKLRYLVPFLTVCLLLSFNAFAQPANDTPCGAIDASPGAPVYACDVTPDDDGEIHSFTYSGTTVDATFRAPFPVCPDGDNGPNVIQPTGDVWVKFIASGVLNTISMTSPDFEAFQLIAYTGRECTSMAIDACGYTVPGINALEQVVLAVPGDTIYLQISGNRASGTTGGRFNLNVSSEASCQPCASLGDGTITMSQAGEGGRYVCGSTVNICLELRRYIGNDLANNNEYLHSFVPTFGPGWDVSTIEPTVLPVACSGPNNQGSWQWFPEGWTSCATGEFIPRGVAYESNQGLNQACPDGPSGTGPGDNYGDGYGGGNNECVNRMETTTFCFNIDVLKCPDEGGTAMNLDSLYLNISVYSDGVTGSWSNDDCSQNLDFAQTDIYTLVCDAEPPAITVTQETCIDQADGTAIISPNAGMPGTALYNFVVSNSENRTVFSCDGCMGEQILTGLPGGTYTVQVNDIDTPCPQSTSFTIETNPSRIPVLTVSDAGPCPGESVRFAVSGGGAPYEWYQDGELIVGETGRVFNFLSDTSHSENRYTFSVVVLGGDCPNITLSEDIIVSPHVDGIVQGPDEVCIGGTVTLYARQADGSRFPADFTYQWDGRANLDADSLFLTYNPLARPIIGYVMVTNPDGCTDNIPYRYQITPPTNVLIEPDDAVICREGSVELCAELDRPSASATYVWNTGNPADTTRCITVNGASTNLTNIIVTVNAGGCTDDSPPVEVVVSAPLSGIVIDPCPQSVGGITFTWNDNSQDYFRVYVSIDGGPEMLVDSNYTDLSYRVEPLSAEQSATIRVVPVVQASGGDCLGESVSQTCSTLPCQDPGWSVAVPRTVCVRGAATSVEATILTALPGTVILNSTDLGLTNDTLPSSGFYSFSLPPLPTGQRSGIYTITATHTPADPSCATDRVIVIEVVAPATGAITLSDNLICRGEQVVLNYDGDPTGLTFSWSLPAGAVLVSGSIQTAGPITVEFLGTSPTQQIGLLVSDLICDMITLNSTLTVEAPLPAPIVDCVPTGVTSIQFTWGSIPGADEYELILNGGTPIVQTGTNFEATGLNAGSIATLVVRALGSGSCGNGPAGSSGQCRTENCPTFSTNLNGLTDSLCTGTNTVIDLSGITVSGGTGAMASYTFSGTGVSGTDFNTTGLSGEVEGASYPITLTYTEQGGCTYSDEIVIRLFSPPVVTVAPDRDELCIGETASILISSTNLDPDPSQNIDFDGGTVVPDANPSDNIYIVRWTTPGVKQITATVPNAILGCLSAPDVATVEIFAPLDTVNVRCGANELDEVTFEWDAMPGAVNYEVSSTNGQVGSLGAATTSFTVTGLNPGESVSLTVIPISASPCGTGPRTTVACSAATCPGSQVESLTVGISQCLDGTTMQIPLEAALDGGATPAGPITWAGTGVEQLPTGEYIWNPAGLPAGSYDVTVSYDGPNLCDSEDLITFRLVDQPSAVITASAGDVCLGDTVRVGLAGPTVDGVLYNWGDFNGADVIIALGDEQYQLVWNDPPGDRVIRLTATTTCVEMDSIELDVVPLLDPPRPVCAGIGVDRIRFEWAEVLTAVEYIVRVEGQAPMPPQTETVFEVTGLMPMETVRIFVTAVRIGTNCNESTEGTIICAAEECPALTIAPSAAQTAFCETDTVPVDLEANLGGNDGTGTLTWTGPGTRDNLDGTFSFDPQAAGTGVHVLTASYVEDRLCIVSDTLSITVTALPDPSFTLSETNLCLSDELTITASPGPGTISVTNTGGSITPTADPNVFTARFTTTGTFEITATRELNGCADAATQSVTIQPGPNSGTPNPSPLTVCPGDNSIIQLADLLTDEDDMGTWTSVGDPVPVGAFTASDGTLDNAALTAGRYEFTYTVPGAATCSDAASTVVVLVTQPADPGFVLSSRATCIGSPVTLMLNSDPGAATVTYNTPGATQGMDASGKLTLTYSSAGTYSVSVTTENNDCSAMSQVFDVLVQASFDAGTPTPLTRCISDAGPVDLFAQLTGADGGGEWTVASGLVLPGSLNPVTGMLITDGISPGNYAFTYTLDGGSCGLDSAFVALSLVAAPAADAGPDREITCSVDMVTVGGGITDTSPGTTYRWSNDDGSVMLDTAMATLVVGQAGTYTLTVENEAGCISTDEVVVTSALENPTMQVQLSNISCFSGSDGVISVTDVTGGQPPYTFSLNGEPRGPARLFTGLSSQEYELEVTDVNGCTSRILLGLQEPDELSIELRFPNDTAVTDYGEEIVITASVQGGSAIDTLIWEPDSLVTGEGINGIAFIATETRTISVTVVDSLGCTASDNSVLIVRKDRALYFPNAFSPNGDGNNDIFFIGGDPDFVVSLEEFKIFDRWGEQMFDSDELDSGDGNRFPPNSPYFGWNGVHNGKLMNPQVFVFTVRANFADGTSETYSGDFVLLR